MSKPSPARRSLKRLVMRLLLVGDERVFRHFYAGRYSKRMSLIEANWLSTVKLREVGYHDYYHVGCGRVVESPRTAYWRKSHNNRLTDEVSGKEPNE